VSKKRDKPGPRPSRSPLGVQLLLPALLIAGTVVVYLNSFDGVLVLDDQRCIAEDPGIQRLWPPWPLLARRRPVVRVSLAANFALSGFDLWGYHAFNLLIHVLAGLTLYGIVRRTLRLGRFRDRWGEVAALIAFVIALLWSLHPLQTQSVTYLIQRAESMMGLFYLLTIYCLLRGATSARSLPWYVAAIASCTLGMGSKGVMITAPVLVLLFDRVFVAPSLGQILRKRWGLYIGLFATWGVIWASGLVKGVFATSGTNATVGLSYKGIPPLEYALTQLGVILHYLRLALWPHPLCLDYDWPVATSAAEILLPAIVLIVLLGVTVWGLVRKPWLGFLGAWFFIILSPTSSVIPLRDPLFEHRMYLPLAALVIVLVMGGHLGWGILAARWRLSGSQSRVSAGLVVALIAVILGLGTVDRNRDYYSAVTMWTDIATKRPYSDRARYNLGATLLSNGRVAEAEAAFGKALDLNPRADRALYNLGKIHEGRQDIDQAFRYFAAAVEANPRLAEAHSDLANILVLRNEIQQALQHYRDAIEAKPRYVQARFNLGNILVATGEIDEGVAELAEAVRLAPNTPHVHFALGQGLEKQGKPAEAAAEYRRTLELDPEHVNARRALAALRGVGQSPVGP